MTAWLAILTCFALAGFIPAAEHQPDITKANAALGEAFVQLLNSKDADAFARAVSPTKQELETLAGTKDGKTSLSSYASSRLKLNRELGKRLLQRAEEHGFDSRNLKFQLKPASAEGLFISKNTPYVNGSHIDTAWLLPLVMTAERSQKADPLGAPGGEYEISVFRPKLFPNGWRITESAWWSRSPVELGNSCFRWETSFLNSIPTNRPPFIIKHDPALETAGYALIRFMQMGDDTNLSAEAGRSFEEFYAQELKRSGGLRDLPPKEELRKAWNSHMTDFFQKPAREMVRQLQASGIDLSDAEITLKTATAEVTDVGKLMVQAEVNGVRSTKLEFTFTVKSDRKTNDGKPLSGKYAIVVGRAERDANRWTITGPVAWSKLPENPGANEQSVIALERHLAEKQVLPPGMTAPEATMPHLDDGKMVNLGDYRGKVVLLDFWASWCAPCQPGLAAMQTLYARNPGWRDRVVLLTISLDDTAETAREHLKKNGWNQTLNTWAGEGGHRAPAASAFHVRKLPTTYVIDPQGKIVPLIHLSPEMVKNSRGDVTDVRPRTVEELEQSITPLLKAGSP